MASPNTLRRSQISSRLGESRLEALLESAELLHASLRLEDLLRHLLRTVMGRLLVGRAAVAIRQDGAMRVALARGVASLPAGSEFSEAIALSAGLEQVFPIGDPEFPIGLLGLSKPMRGDLDPEEHDFIHALISLSASGIANAQAHTESVRLNHSLDQKIQELRALLDMVRGLAATLDPEAIAQLLALTLPPLGRSQIRRRGLARATPFDAAPAWSRHHRFHRR